MLTHFFRSVVSLIIFVTSAAAQQPGEVSYADKSDFPGGIEGEVIRAVIDAVNAGDSEAVLQFLGKYASESFKNSVPDEVLVNVWLGFTRQTGGVDFHGIRTYVPPRTDETVVILKDRIYEAWRAFVLQFDDNDHVSGLSFSDARLPTNVTYPKLTEADAFSKIEATVKRVCARDVFSGTVLVADGNEVRYQNACGEASKRFHVPNRIDTKFNLGSMNKMFTATAVMQLAELGLLSVDDPISKWVDESWLPQSITDKVTVHHLLTHTSGLGSYFNRTYMQTSRELYRSLDDFKPLVNGDSLAFDPGSRFQYSNTGMLLLGVVIEGVTNRSYFDVIRDNVYGPAGMKDSDSYEMDYPVENLAIGYIPVPTSPYGWQNNLFQHVIKGGPAGGGFSTVEDLHSYAVAMIDGRLVSSQSLDTMWISHSDGEYGYGFGISSGPAGKTVGHGGGFPGLNGRLTLHLDSGYIVAVLSNHDQAALPLANHINTLLGRVSR